MHDVSHPSSGTATKPTPLPRNASTWAFLAIAVVVGFGAYLGFVSVGPLAIDDWWHGAARVERSSLGHALAVFMAEVGGGIGAASCAAIAAALFFAVRLPRGAATVLTAMLLGIAGSELLKALVSRPRPWDQLYSAAGSSYPSGHTMGAAALAVSIALVACSAYDFTSRQAAGVWSVAILWVATMAWSRTALHVHWLTDTLAGALLGTAAALIALALWHPERTVDQVNVSGSL
ncbi:undecaprenyl-diphosphatase [Leucobacter exalbidus]|uniref:Undecaprenyl-diphosphatase n=1 Tax=Leucobacter exalbidus TaxID=662960 RepID=A0A940T4H0_9MICO|nr:phosphatase PAP2 family protein [Leucobacter exalbidus]MBP1327227.1 undecaprenyl-diphosphatase [Leucobacter exalbidus]